MRWKNARRSDNVEDRRLSGGRGKGKLAAGGGLSLVIAIVGVLFFGGDPASLLQSIGGGGAGATQSPAMNRELTAAEKEHADFVRAVLGYTEDVWDEHYPRLARAYDGAPAQYPRPKLVLFASQVATACGHAESSVGPFYCPGDNQVYIDLTFFGELARKFKAPGDFAQAYVVAHEVGHHIQNLLGLTRKVDQVRRTASKKVYNQMSVRLELQADFFAGVWAHQAQKKYDILEVGDLEEGLTAAAAVGDDTIQKRARGYVVPESFSHGTSEQRMRWFRKGLKSGDPLSDDPFKLDYEDL
jgi:uncharacterized protein